MSLISVLSSKAVVLGLGITLSGAVVGTGGIVAFNAINQPKQLPSQEVAGAKDKDKSSDSSVSSSISSSSSSSESTSSSVATSVSITPPVVTPPVVQSSSSMYMEPTNDQIKALIDQKISEGKLSQQNSTTWAMKKPGNNLQCNQGWIKYEGSTGRYFCSFPYVDNQDTYDRINAIQ